ncbi:Aste57867_13411 [Aphanomyces stellatus]|uniref:Aste57867_13411 protein n=1 Tax=Aphanomyces stellatus TaxID=120398 RepID=A0A485KYY3_9STRA|nr:hypothetical protein As57867_013361 [Aphanomyces stellatus]VFT90250.1 Aste57867_13411 [Aphanomyces stellatus]
MKRGRGRKRRVGNRVRNEHGRFTKDPPRTSSVSSSSQAAPSAVDADGPGIQDDVPTPTEQHLPMEEKRKPSTAKIQTPVVPVVAVAPLISEVGDEPRPPAEIAPVQRTNSPEIGPTVTASTVSATATMANAVATISPSATRASGLPPMKAILSQCRRLAYAPPSSPSACDERLSVNTAVAVVVPAAAPMPAIVIMEGCGALAAGGDEAVMVVAPENLPTVQSFLSQYKTRGIPRLGTDVPVARASDTLVAPPLPPPELEAAKAPDNILPPLGAAGRLVALPLPSLLGHHPDQLIKKKETADVAIAATDKERLTSVRSRQEEVDQVKPRHDVDDDDSSDTRRRTRHRRDEDTTHPRPEKRMRREASTESQSGGHSRRRGCSPPRSSSRHTSSRTDDDDVRQISTRCADRPINARSPDDTTIATLSAKVNHMERMWRQERRAAADAMAALVVKVTALENAVAQGLRRTRWLTREETNARSSPPSSASSRDRRSADHRTCAA